MSCEEESDADARRDIGSLSAEPRRSVSKSGSDRHAPTDGSSSSSSSEEETTSPPNKRPRRAHVKPYPQFAYDPRVDALLSQRGGGGGAQVMEGGVAAPPPRRAPPAPPGAPPPPPERSPARAGLHVNFSDKGEVKERREKFLTAKYGSHQMALIRKRLAVEMWLYDELQKLYDVPKEAAGGAGAGGAGGAAPAQEVEVDVDELLDMDSDELRRAHLATLLADAKKPQKDVHKFINELLDKAKTL